MVTDAAPLIFFAATKVSTTCSMGTWDFLRQREEMRRSQSADAVRTGMLAAGLSLPTRDLFSRHDPGVRDAVRGSPKGASN